MPTDFFAEPDFLALLRFWEEARGGAGLPAWDGDLARVPSSLRPNLIVSDRRGAEPVYVHVGPEAVRRWGPDPSAKPVYTVLKGVHARYIRALGDEAFERCAPVFSASVYRLADEALLLTGRLLAPFAAPGGEAPAFVMAVQLFRGPDVTLAGLGEAVFVDEIQRQMIAGAPALCARLEEARRYHSAARRLHQEAVAREMQEVARDLAGSALVTLPRFRDAAA
jgi:hypothetical protein